jgi:putative ABC transport system permease protein
LNLVTFVFVETLNMQLSENILQSFRSIKSNWLRSLLTCAIIGFGLMALVGILTAIDGILNSMSSSFTSVGSNAYSIEPAWSSITRRTRGVVQKQANTISFKQAQDFKDRFDRGDKVSIHMDISNFGTVQFQTKKTNPNVSIVGIDDNFLSNSGLEIAHGRSFTSLETEEGAQRIILGMDVVKSLFDGEGDRAIGQTITLGNIPYQVVGVLSSKGASFNQSGDRQVLIPLPNGRKLSKSTRSNFQLKVGVQHTETIDESIEYAIGLMRSVRKLKPGAENDFEIQKSDTLINIIKDNTVTIRLATIAIGLITLLGAAIGLMNIMLVSVTERTREIGIVKALGATKNSILIQFLTESVVICQIGGIMGIILGMLMGNIVTFIIGGAFIVPWLWITIGLITCFIVGIASGIYPATKAANLDPIEALRYE